MGEDSCVLRTAKKKKKNQTTCYMKRLNGVAACLSIDKQEIIPKTVSVSEAD